MKPIDTHPPEPPAPQPPRPHEEWQPDALLVSVVRQPSADSADAAPEHSAIDHVRHPFAFEMAQEDLPLLLGRVQTYLGRVQGLLGLPNGLIDALESKERGLGFRWLGSPFGPPMSDKAAINPAQSFRVRRSNPRRANGEETTLVLLAGNTYSAGAGDEPIFLGAHVGLRVDVLLGPLPGAPVNTNALLARIVGASTSQLTHALLPDPMRLLRFDPLRARERLRSSIAEALGMTAENTLIDGLGYAAAGDTFDVDFISGISHRDGRAFTWSFIATFDRGDYHLLPLTRLEQVSHAGQAMLQDPVSRGSAATANLRRPVRNDAKLNAWRTAAPSLPGKGARLSTAEYEVRHSVVPYPSQAGDQWKQGNLAELRSDDLSAAHVYQRLHEFFARLHGYGFDVLARFRWAALPIVGVPRAALPRAPDGRTVNAAVRATPQVRNDGTIAPSRLEVGFGAAQLSRRTEPPHGANLRAEPMGLAADERWAWHEFGHVLAHAATGQLEFRFSHGVGDALAAVIADPDSQLHDAPEVAALTFPFVALGRRHNRPAALGWCFCGRRNGLRAPRGTRAMRAYAGYFEEQLFSTAAYRLYQSLGGATRNLLQPLHAGDRAMRYSASDYVVYLLMRAINTMSPDTSTPTSSADDFVFLIGRADAATRHFYIRAGWPERDTPRHVRRRGGRAGKVIAWAFEQQGLDARVPVEQTREGPAAPPAVDVYIRACAPERASGGYEALPLRWVVSPQLPWHSSGIATQGAAVQVQVHNRGTQRALGVTVQAWWCEADAPGFLKWQSLASTISLGLDVPEHPKAGVAFGFAKPATGGPYWVFAAADCTEDRSNINPATRLPFADGQPPKRRRDLMELVANDNNCGLALLP